MSDPRGQTINAVLLIDDQLQDNAPTHCVITGKHTEGAVKAWSVEAQRGEWLMDALGVFGVGLARLTGRQVMRVLTPVDPLAWTQWQQRSTAALAVLGIGVGALIMGFIQVSAGMVLFGLVGVVAALWLRVRFVRNHWVTMQLRPSTNDILVRRAHPQFGQDAQRLYTAASRRR